MEQDVDKIIAIAGVTTLIAEPVKVMVKQGLAWIAGKLAPHSDEVNLRSEHNFVNFVKRLAKRVENLEAELDDPGKAVYDEALRDPETSLLLQKAFVSAAVTDNDDRHIVLSELIAQRLTAGADDMVALIGQAACDIVNSLASRHIRLLAVLVRIYSIRPTVPFEGNNQAKYDEYALKWWAGIAPLTEVLDQCQPFDLKHLEGLSCLKRISLIGRQLDPLLKLRSTSELQPTDGLLKKAEWYPHLSEHWHRLRLDSVDMTTVGEFIGILCHDSIVGVPTTLTW